MRTEPTHKTLVKSSIYRVHYQVRSMITSRFTSRTGCLLALECSTRDFHPIDFTVPLLWTATVAVPSRGGRIVSPTTKAARVIHTHATHVLVIAVNATLSGSILTHFVRTFTLRSCFARRCRSNEAICASDDIQLQPVQRSPAARDNRWRLLIP